MIQRFAVLACLIGFAAPALAHANERGEAKATVAGKTVAIEYGRPMLQGRDMIGRAEVGKPWRLGADAATTLKTEADLSFGGAAVPPGEYVLKATKQADGSWQLNVLTREQARVVDVPLATESLKDSVETLTLELKAEKEKGELSICWGTTALKATFTGK